MSHNARPNAFLISEALPDCFLPTSATTSSTRLLEKLPPNQGDTPTDLIRTHQVDVTKKPVLNGIRFGSYKCCCFRIGRFLVWILVGRPTTFTYVLFISKKKIVQFTLQLLTKESSQVPSQRLSSEWGPTLWWRDDLSYTTGTTGTVTGGMLTGKTNPRATTRNSLVLN
jgi:hypothetical protein